MTGPPWLAAAFAVVMLAIAVYCAGRLAVFRRWRRSTELDTDSVHAVMGVAMAGMLVPRLSPLPTTAWEAVFALAAAWFAFQAVQGWRRSTGASRWQSPHPVPHLVESAAMIYMLAALPGSWPGWPGQAMAMPGMAGGHSAGGGSVLTLAVLLALFMLGYVLWTADQLTSLVRVTAPATPARDQPGTAVTAAAPVSVTGTRAAAGEAHSAGPGRPAGGPVLAPRLAACSKIAMGITMGYMLLLML